MKKLITLILFLSFSLIFLGTPVAMAQEAGTLLPETTKSDTECNSFLKDKLFNLNELKYEKDGQQVTTNELSVYFAHQPRDFRNNVLACAVITGQIKFWMVPFYIVYLIEFAIGISGLVAIAFLVVGGFQYVIGGATEKQESAKNTIKFALIGLVIVLLAWVLVNLVQFIITI